MFVRAIIANNRNSTCAAGHRKPPSSVPKAAHKLAVHGHRKHGFNDSTSLAPASESNAVKVRTGHVVCCTPMVSAMWQSAEDKRVNTRARLANVKSRGGNKFPHISADSIKIIMSLLKLADARPNAASTTA
jgi:hypothetical protein